MRILLLILLLIPLQAHAMAQVVQVVGAVLVTVPGFQVVGWILLTVGGVYGASQARKEAARQREQARQAYNNGLQDRTITRVATDAPFVYVYGRARVGSAVVGMFTSGTNDEYRHLVCVHAAHECDAIEEIYINGKALGTLDANGDVTGGDFYVAGTLHSNNPTGKRGGGPVIPETHTGISFALNFTPVSGSLKIYKRTLVARGYTLAEITPVSVVGKTVTLDIDHGTVETTYQYSTGYSQVRVQKHLGTADDIADATLMAEVPAKWGTAVSLSIASPAVVSWQAHGLSAGTQFSFGTTGALPTGAAVNTPYYVISAGLTADTFEFSATPGGAAINTSGTESGQQYASTAVLRGLCYTVVRLDLHQAEFQGGLPSVEVLLRGKKLYDLRDTTTAWSQNPALAIYDYLTSEMCGVDAADLPSADFIAAANVCDPIGGCTYVQSGTTVTVTKTAHGLAVNDVREMQIGTGTAVGGHYKITAVTANTFTYTAGTSLTTSGSLTVAGLYTVNGTVTADMAQDQTLEHMAQAMAGLIVKTTWGIQAGKYVAPVMALQQSDIVGQLSIIPGTSDAQIYNGVKGQFTSSETGYVATDFAPYQNATYLASDGRELWTNIDFPFTDQTQRVQNLCRIFTEDQRNGYTLTGVWSQKIWDLQVGKRVTFTSALLGQTSKVYRLTDKKYTPDAMIEASFKEDVSTIWDFDDAIVVDSTPNTGLPNPFTIAALASLTCTSDSTTLLTQKDGTVVSRILAQWPQCITQSVLANGYIELQWSAALDGVWHSVQLYGSATETYIPNVSDGELYSVRIRSANPYQQVKSDWTYATAIIAASKSALPDGLATLVGTGGVFLNKLTWTFVPDPLTIDYTAIYGSTTNDRATATPLAAVKSPATEWTHHNITPGVAWYYWAETVDTSANISAWYPVSATGGVTATPTPITVADAPTFIQDLAVDTLQIADQAVTIPVSIYSAGSVSFISGGSVTLITGIIASSGGQIHISSSFQYESYPASATSIECLAYIIRDGADLVGGPIWRTAYPDDVMGSYTITFTDTPGAGSHTYEIAAQWVYITGSTPPIAASAYNISLLLLETKK